MVLCAMLLPYRNGMGQQHATKVLRINGSGVASDQVSDCAQKFMASHPGVSIAVTGTSAGKGLEYLLEGRTELAIMSRQILPEEEEAARRKGILLKSKSIGQVGLAIITHPRNPVNELSVEQIAQIFCGAYASWKQVGGPNEPVRPVTRRVPDSGAAVFFQDAVMGGRAFSGNTALAATWRTVFTLCADEKALSIGIAPPNRALADKTVKVVAVRKGQSGNGRLPTADHISDGSYPIILPFILVWRYQDEPDELLEFVEFCSRK